MRQTPTPGTPSPTAQPFLSDLKTLRERARRQIEEGVVTSTYLVDAGATIEVPQTVLASELVCVLRYTQHAITATGVSSEGVKAEFAEHAREEQGHAMVVAERINQLGGTPDFNPKGLAGRSASEYGAGVSLAEMISENLVAERIAIDHYRELARLFGDRDPTTRVMIEQILAVEEQHASVMNDLLLTHGGAKA